MKKMENESTDLHELTNAEKLNFSGGSFWRWVNELMSGNATWIN